MHRKKSVASIVVALLMMASIATRASSLLIGTPRIPTMIATRYATSPITPLVSSPFSWGSNKDNTLRKSSLLLHATAPTNNDGNYCSSSHIESIGTRVPVGAKGPRSIHTTHGNRTATSSESGRPPIPPARRAFATSATTPWIVPKTIDIPEDKVEISFVRSSGAGGQNVNKVSTKVEIRMHVPSAAIGDGGGGWIPGEVRDRLAEQQAHRISKDGMLTVTSQEYRTQGQNRKAAFDKLRQLILDAWPRPKVRVQRTGPSKAAKERNKDFKRQRSETKQNRKRVDW